MEYKAEGLDPEGRYDVKRRNDESGKHEHCRYFVLDLTHDPLAHAALCEYARVAMASDRLALAHDLVELLATTEYDYSTMKRNYGEDGTEYQGLSSGTNG